jgi:hypothetical protein
MENSTFTLWQYRTTYEEILVLELVTSTEDFDRRRVERATRTHISRYVPSTIDSSLVRGTPILVPLY